MNNYRKMFVQGVWFAISSAMVPWSCFFVKANFSLHNKIGTVFWLIMIVLNIFSARNHCRNFKTLEKLEQEFKNQAMGLVSDVEKMLMPDNPNNSKKDLN